jgi:hypothetical protein
VSQSQVREMSSRVVSLVVNVLLWRAGRACRPFFLGVLYVPVLDLWDCMCVWGVCVVSLRLCVCFCLGNA